MLVRVSVGRPGGYEATRGVRLSGWGQPRLHPWLPLVLLVNSVALLITLLDAFTIKGRIYILGDIASFGYPSRVQRLSCRVTTTCLTLGQSFEGTTSSLSSGSWCSPACRDVPLSAWRGEGSYPERRSRLSSVPPCSVLEGASCSFPQR